MHTTPPRFSRRRAALLTGGAFLSFLLFGFLDNLKGPILPSLLSDLGFGYAYGGALVLGSALGFLISTLLMGRFSDAIGNRIVLVVACTLLGLGVIGFSLVSAFGLLLATMVVVGLGIGAIEVGGNLSIVELHPTRKGRFLNLLAFSHGTGALLAPLFSARLLTHGHSWRDVYRASLPLVLAVLVFYLVVSYPRARRSGRSASLREIGRTAFRGDMLLFFLVILLYVCVEIGIATWLVAFLQDAKGLDVGRSSLYLSGFFAALTGGRLLGGFFIERLGYMRTLVGVSVLSTCCIGVGLVGSGAATLFLPLSGLFLSVTFPTVTAIVSDLHPEHTGSILGLLFAFAGVGGMLGPWTTGLASDWLGIGRGFGVMLLFSLFLLATLVILKQHLAPALPPSSEGAG